VDSDNIACFSLSRDQWVLDQQQQQQIRQSDNITLPIHVI
jgi:hypothetical protein